MSVSPGVIDLLAAWNATLNGTAGVLVVLALRAIRARQVERHRKLMLTAVGVSAAFLVSYLLRVALSGPHPFPVSGLVRWLYLALLLSHTLLAMLAAPLILRTAFLGLKGRLDSHRRVARFTAPVWLYVSATGVLVYLFLYQIAPRL